jgi:hypothetical protein
MAVALAGTGVMSPAFAQSDSAPIIGLQHNVVFADYPEFSRSREVARRTLSPLASLEIMRAAAKSGLRAQAIDLQQETFSVYVPRKRPPLGYGVLVFVPPWEDARLPAGWGPVLDASGLILVCAAKSGNEASVIDRRIPLALLGVYNIIRSHPIDADRVYIGGFSGGARVAMRVALGYPDLFRGALLNAGSDPIADKGTVLPPNELFAQFQNSSRLVYVTGSDDSSNIDRDMASRGSMSAWCVFGTEVQTMPWVGHEIATADFLRRAIVALDRRSPVDAGRLAACRARIAKEMTADLAQVEHLLDLNEPHEAWRLLNRIDGRYAGLALPDILKFELRIGSRR